VRRARLLPPCFRAGQLYEAEVPNLRKDRVPTLKELLLAPEPRADIPVPKRGKLRHRDPPNLDDAEPTRPIRKRSSPPPETA
jgi:hypothetical protein